MYNTITLIEFKRKELVTFKASSGLTHNSQAFKFGSLGSPSTQIKDLSKKAITENFSVLCNCSNNPAYKVSGKSLVVGSTT